MDAETAIEVITKQVQGRRMGQVEVFRVFRCLGFGFGINQTTCNKIAKEAKTRHKAACASTT
jgi:hypothetical protein